MEFTTPASYGNTVVNVSALAKDNEIISAGASSSAKHTTAHKDSENDWPEPKSVSLEWRGQTRDGQPVVADAIGELGPRLDRVDVLAHVPGFVKTIVGGVVGTKPFIYQVCHRSLVCRSCLQHIVLSQGSIETQGQHWWLRICGGGHTVLGSHLHLLTYSTL